MKTISIVIICFLLTSCSPAYKYDKADKILLTTAIVAQVADAVTTSQALDRGAVEVNPIYGDNPSDATLILSKVAVVGVLIWAGSKMKPTPRKWVFGIATALGGGAAIHNSQVNK